MSELRSRRQGHIEIRGDRVAPRRDLIHVLGFEIPGEDGAVGLRELAHDPSRVFIAAPAG